MELKIHDKEEIAWKQLNSQHKDKDGLKENELRQKLIGIMSSYDLLEHFEDTQDVDKTKPYKVNNPPKKLLEYNYCTNTYRNSMIPKNGTRIRAYLRIKN